MLESFFGLLLYLLQQFGVTLAVGASTFAIMFYIVGISDGVIDASERRFMRSVYTTLRIGLYLIITTGILITGAHYFAGESEIILSPTYLFKWILILIIILNGALMDLRMIPRYSYFGGAIAGASWYALFIVHTLSLTADWMTLFVLYFAWLITFLLGFTLIERIASSKYKKEGTPVRTPVPLPRPPAPPYNHIEAELPPKI